MTMVRGRVMMLGVARGHGVMSLSLGQLPMLSHGDGHHWRSDQMSLSLSSTSLGRVYIGPLSVWLCALVSGLQLAHDWLMSCWGPHSGRSGHSSCTQLGPATRPHSRPGVQITTATVSPCPRHWQVLSLSPGLHPQHVTIKKVFSKFVSPL